MNKFRRLNLAIGVLLTGIFTATSSAKILSDDKQDLDTCVYVLKGPDGFYNAEAKGEDLYNFLGSKPKSPIRVEDGFETLSIMCLAKKLPLIQFDKTILGTGMSSVKLLINADGSRVLVHYKIEADKLVYEIMDGTLSVTQKAGVENSIKDYNEN